MARRAVKDNREVSVVATVQFSGLASGIDSQSLIDAIIEAREAVNRSRRSEIEYLQGENDSLEELRTKLIALHDLVDQFRTSNGGGVTKKATSSSSTVATAVAGSTASNASLTLTSTALARTATGSIYHGAATYTATSSVFDATATGTGEITILVGTGSNQVTITASSIGATTTVQEVVDKINNDSDASGKIVATAVNVGTSSNPSYKIALTGQQAGTDLGTVAVSFGGLSGSIAYDNSAQATNASFTIAGINGTITRATNSISDVIPGMTFQLLSAGTATITVGDDADGTQEKISQIVEAYNDVVEYISEHDEITRQENGLGATNSFGSLAKTDVDDDFLSYFRTNLSAASASSGSAVTAFSEMGLSTNRDGTLAFDEEAFQIAMGDDSAGVGEVLVDFADSVAGVSGTIYQFTKIQGFIDNAIDANNDKINNLGDAIERVERASRALRENLQGQFSRLEALSAELQSTQATLTGILAGLNA